MTGLGKADKNRIEELIRGIDRFQTGIGSGTTRILFTEPELQARTYVKEKMKELGLSITEDSAGNIFGTLFGSCSNEAPVWTGSHIDTVPNAGMFDGMAGVVCGLEALRLIKDSGINHRRNISVIVYTSEEPTRFGLSCLGSRAMAGVLNIEDTKLLKDHNGKSLYELLNEVGYNTSEFDKVKKKEGDVFAFVELHIEQNSRLEKAGLKIGAVRGICAPTNFDVTVRGIQSHAGGTPMTERHDAFMAAAELALRIEDIAKKSESEYITATVGKVDVFPNAVNVIPGEVKLTIDIRSIDMNAKEAAVEFLCCEAERIRKERGVEIIMRMENHDTPLRCNEHILGEIHNSCSELGIKYLDMISGPYHDSLFVGRFAPTAMIFVPSKNGISHSENEWTDFEDLSIGADVLANTLLKISNLEESEI